MLPAIPGLGIRNEPTPEICDRLSMYFQKRDGRRNVQLIEGRTTLQVQPRRLSSRGHDCYEQTGYE